jgi:osmotically-inducible protein OsmY
VAPGGQPLPTLVDGILLEPLDHLGIRASRAAPGEPRLLVAGTPNAWTVAKVQSTLVADRAVSAGEIRVEADDSGLVTLRGRVRAPDVAAQAVRDALSTKGVSAVDSYLTW